MVDDSPHAEKTMITLIFPSIQTHTDNQIFHYKFYFFQRKAQVYQDRKDIVSYQL